MGMLLSTGEVAEKLQVSPQYLLWLNSIARLNVPRFSKKKLLAWSDSDVVTVSQLLKRRKGAK